jgi:hypothetical protein
MKHVKFYVLVLAISQFVFGAGDAMFGLSWGMSPSQIKKMGIKIEKKGAQNNIYSYHCDSLPKNVSISDGYALYFDEDTALVKIIMLSNNIENDPYGREGKEQFDKMVTLLRQKYKVKDSFCYTGRKLYEESDEFYQCLKYEGCGSWTTFFESENKNICINIVGVNRGEGYIKISVEAEPEFSNAIDKSKQKTSVKDGDAF